MKQYRLIYSQGTANSVAEEALGAMSTVRAFAGEAEEYARYEKNLHLYSDTNNKRAVAYWCVWLVVLLCIYLCLRYVNSRFFPTSSAYMRS